jgi:Tat protein translocase TatB subunit
VILFILESIGTQELVIIGIVALMFLGPRKMPEYARKLGKVMADFRNTTSEFKETWEREVNFAEEAEALRMDDLLEDEAEDSRPLPSAAAPVLSPAPEIKELNREEFEKRTSGQQALPYEADSREDSTTAYTPAAEDKRNWL